MLFSALRYSDHPWAVCSEGEKRHSRKGVFCCRTTRGLPAAHLPSSGMSALTGWVTGEDSLLQTGDIFNQSLMIIVCTWGKFTLSGHWWKMCHASRCSSWGCRKRLESGALQGLGGCGEECLTSGLLSCELNWFNVRTNHKSQSVWKMYSCQSTFSRKLALIFSKKKNKPESLLWNRGTIYKKILLPTSWSFLSC